VERKNHQRKKGNKMLSKDEVLEILKKNNFNEEQAEQLLEMMGKGLGNSFIDLVKLLAEKSENKYDDVVVASIESKARELVNDLEVKL
jgi:hypothetical protein